MTDVHLARCKNLIEPEGTPCGGLLHFGPGDLDAPCDTCGARCGCLVADYIAPPTYPEEILSGDDDDGTMPNNVDALAQAVVGCRIVSVEKGMVKDRWGSDDTPTVPATIITLDNGRRVGLADTDDCCAHTMLDNFLLHPERVDHIITGVGTTDGFTKWHIYADLGDVLELSVDWSPGNPFYYGYGFDITVEDLPEEH